MCSDGELLLAHSIRITAMIDLELHENQGQPLAKLRTHYRIKPTCANPSFSCGRMELAFPAKMAPTMMCSPDEAAGICFQ